MIAPASAGDRQRQRQADPRAYPEMEEQRRRRVGAEADVEGVAERELAGKAHHDVPGLAGIGEVEDEDEDREQVVVDKERRGQQGRKQDEQQDEAAARDVGEQRGHHVSFFPRMPCGPEQQHQHEDAEGEHALGGRRIEQPRQRLGEPDQHPAQQRAGHRAEPTGNDDDERQQRIGGPERGRHVDHQREHDAGGADAGGADAEGEGVEALHVEADHQRAGIVVGAGADRLAEHGEAEEGEQRGRDQHGGRARIGLAGVNDQPADLEAVERVGGLHVAGVGPEHDELGVDEDDRHRHQQHELAVLGPVDERIDDAGLQEVAEREQGGGRRHQHDERVEPQRGEGDDGRIHGERHHLAVGEVDHAHDAEDDGQAERHQAVDEAREQAVDGHVEVDLCRHLAVVLPKPLRPPGRPERQTNEPTQRLS